MLVNWSPREKRLLVIILGGLVLIGLLALLLFKSSQDNDKTGTDSATATSEQSNPRSGGDLDETAVTNDINNNGKSSSSGTPASNSTGGSTGSSSSGTGSSNSSPASGSSSASIPAQPTMSTVTNSKSFAAVAFDSVAVTCPAGTIAVGGGLRGAESTKFFASYLTNNGWYARGVNGTLSSSVVNVYAQCVDNVPGSVTVSTATTTISALGSGTINKDCASGTTVVSGGFDNSENGATITFSNRVNNGWRANAVSEAVANQTLKVMTNCYTGGAVTVTQTLDNETVPAGWTWTKAKACDNGMAIMGGFASQAELFSSYYNVNNSKWTTVVFNRTNESVNLKAYFYCAVF